MRFAHHKSGAQSTHRDLNVEPLVARLTLGKVATLYELQTMYAYADMFYLDEVLCLQEEAEYLAERKTDGKNSN